MPSSLHSKTLLHHIVVRFAQFYEFNTSYLAQSNPMIGAIEVL